MCGRVGKKENWQRSRLIRFRVKIIKIIMMMISTVIITMMIELMMMMVVVMEMRLLMLLDGDMWSE